MLGLQLATDPRWASLAEKSLAEILTDHAYCEQKAASTCISLIQQYPDKEELVVQVAPIVTEEWGHFRMVLQKLKELGLALGFQRPDDYVNELMKFLRKGGSRLDRLTDRLLICAMIEARSCERFRLLSIHLEDAAMRDFYHQFMISEAGHYRLFLDLAKSYEAADKVKNRWKELLDYESSLMAAWTLRGDRIH
jgi:tRNA 2-(methylsulfanyl)-N6-isopentenyladenosine37 hydroxylase